ncbi:MAG: double-cubane-cluster-containing anaerobic reductase [Sedimentisphaerales bacterium]|nr:double-cubane-cluster-containing anaerobic reductase [Sedimentisphaerales bacterium]
MAKFCDDKKSQCDSGTSAEKGLAGGPLEWFGKMIQNCYEYATEVKAKGKHIVGIMCEYTPRELIMAANAVPVCLCGGSAEMIGPAEEDLPVNLCPLIKSTYGYHLKKANPFLEMADLIVAETTCDGKKKMYELMNQTRPMYVLELPQKSQDSDAMAHWISELRKLRTKLQEHFNVEVTDEKIKKAITVMNRERKLRRELATLMKSQSPPLTGRQLLEFKSNISGICADLEQYEEAIKFFQSQKTDCSKNSKVRVLMTGVPIVHGSERVLDIIESHGGLVVCMDNCTGLKPILEDVDETIEDPIVALAEKYFRLPCSVMTKNDRRMDVLRQLFAEYRPQCIIELIWQACLTYDVESYLVKKLAEELGIPYLRIETDYSPSDSARIALRVEALFETVQERAGQSD